MEIIVEEISKQILPFIGGLNWGYIVSFVVITQIFLSNEVELVGDLFEFTKKRVKVAAMGILYAPFYYWLFDLEKGQLGLLFISYLVSFAFHKLIADTIVKKVIRHFPIVFTLYNSRVMLRKILEDELEKEGKDE